MNDCIDSTRLRAHLDQPDRSLEAHLDDCTACPGLLAAVAETAGFARRHVAALDPGTDAIVTADELDAALAQVLRATTVADTPTAVTDRARRRPARARARRRTLAAAAAIVAVTVATPIGRDALVAALDAFRSERIEVIPTDLASWATAPVASGLEALDAVGTVDLSGLSEPVEVADVAAGGRVAGLVPPQVADPAARVVAMAPGTARVVLSQAQDPTLPDELDGATLLVEAPGVVVALAGGDGDAPELVVGRIGPLVLRAEGAPLEAVRAHLVGVDALPEDLRARLAEIDDWRSTIPIPVPLDGPGWREVEIGGRAAIVFGDESGAGALAVRHDPDAITFAGGRISATRAIELVATS